MCYFFSFLQELCLHTKLLASPNTSISDFLSKAPEAPPALVLRNAVALLKVGVDTNRIVATPFGCFCSHILSRILH